MSISVFLATIPISWYHQAPSHISMKGVQGGGLYFPGKFIRAIGILYNSEIGGEGADRP